MLVSSEYFSKYFLSELLLMSLYIFTGLGLCLVFLLLVLTLYLFLSCMNSTKNESRTFVAKTESQNFNVSTGFFLFN